jgi:hypothetical protein
MSKEDLKEFLKCFLCAFAPLRENLFIAALFVQSTVASKLEIEG